MVKLSNHTTGFAQVLDDKRPPRAVGNWSEVWRGVERGATEEWHARPATDLEATIAAFKSALPGWWYSVCECQVSCDASCAPTSESPDIALIEKAGDQFDHGFHADLRQPSSLAAALRDVMEQALAAKARLAESTEAAQVVR